MNRKEIAIEFAKNLKQKEIEKIILYGSVARGDDNTDSDIDILIITENDDDEIKLSKNIYKTAFDFLLKTGEFISPKIFSKNHYKKYKHFSFYSNIDKEGVEIG
ncbi:MAG: nucleotidyltransferase domain-containing protein [Methanobrevibacter sp.]|jgi:predicted nucleotidyltransferase|nr:nucleotidyltransferase domain-containing protein [Candidatus Methanoflexus mossambicus]